MKIDDKVYGRFEIKEPFISLINSEPMQRLKGINQAGPSKYVLPNKNVTRLEHSIGVMRLLQILNASKEEQIAGLLHDVSHTAFSHVVDFLYPNEEHDFHERYMYEAVMNSEIPEILKRSGFNLKRILDHRNFGLLERHIPDLCADRVDYTLRDMLANQGMKRDYIDYLDGGSGEIIFLNREVAINFAYDYLSMDKEVWASPTEAIIFRMFADILEEGLEKGKISEIDLFTDDITVYNKLVDSGDKDIIKGLARIIPELKIDFEEGPFEIYARTKPRYVDPKFLEGGLVKRVSDVTNLDRHIAEHIKNVSEGYYARLS